MGDAYRCIVAQCQAIIDIMRHDDRRRGRLWLAELCNQYRSFKPGAPWGPIGVEGFVSLTPLAQVASCLMKLSKKTDEKSGR